MPLLFHFAFSILTSLSVSSPLLAVDTLTVTTPDPMTEAWRWTTFDHSSGLSGYIRDIYEDRDGNVWFATDQGVQRYDGYSWTNYTTADGLADDEVFAKLRSLGERLRAQPGGDALRELSMGMSRDFEIAIEEGATVVRVGSDLFGPRP